MTIASAFNEIAVANGGTADNSGTITGALDALTDALAGSDQPAPQTIEQGVRMLGEHIGGGGGGEISETNYCLVTDPNGFQYISAPGTEIAINSDGYVFKINDTAQVPTKELELDGDPYAIYTIPGTATAEDNIVIEAL